MIKKPLIQELLSGHTTLLLHENHSNNSTLFESKPLLIVTNMPIEMYLPLIGNWLLYVEYFLDIKVVSTQEFISNKIQYLNSYPLRIMWVANIDSISLTKDILTKDEDYSDNGVTYFVNSREDSIMQLLSNDYTSVRQVFVDNIEIQDIYNSRLSNQDIVNNCHAIFTVIERVYNPKFLKLLFIDLDNTIYEGEIAEGSKNDIFFTKSHVAFIDWLISLAKSGVFIEIVSRNSPNIMNDLRNYPEFLELEKYVTRFNFTLESKGEIIRDRISFYNFLSDAIVLIDDNPAELFDVLRNNDSIRTFRVLPSAANWKIIKFHVYTDPNENDVTTNQFRLADLDANLDRITLSKELSIAELHLYLKTKLNFKVLDPITDSVYLKRCVSMSNRTNQFNVSNRRISESSAFELFKQGYDFVTCSLEDNFGDSGIIFFLIVKQTSKNNANLYELCISCRVLGRNIETIIIVEAVNRWSQLKSQEIKSCSVDFIETSKNLSARKWLQNVGFFENGKVDIARLDTIEEIRVLREVISINAS
jgi:FkbH-like protein